MFFTNNCRTVRSTMLYTLSFFQDVKTLLVHSSRKQKKRFDVIFSLIMDCPPWIVTVYCNIKLWVFFEKIWQPLLSMKKDFKKVWDPWPWKLWRTDMFSWMPFIISYLLVFHQTNFLTKYKNALLHTELILCKEQ